MNVEELKLNFCKYFINTKHTNHNLLSEKSPASFSKWLDIGEISCHKVHGINIDMNLK